MSSSPSGPAVVNKHNIKYQQLIDDVVSKKILLDYVLSWLSVTTSGNETPQKIDTEKSTPNEVSHALSPPSSPSKPPSSPPYPTTPTSSSLSPPSTPTTVPQIDLSLHLTTTFPDKYTRRSFVNYFLEYIHDQANISLTKSNPNTTSENNLQTKYAPGNNHSNNENINNINNSTPTSSFTPTKYNQRSDSLHSTTRITPSPKATYDSNFPSLSPAKPRPTSNSGQRGKGRRITPTLVSTEINTNKTAPNPFAPSFSTPHESNYISAQEERRALVAATKSMAITTNKQKKSVSNPATPNFTPNHSSLPTSITPTTTRISTPNTTAPSTTTTPQLNLPAPYPSRINTPGADPENNTALQNAIAIDSVDLATKDTISGGERETEHNTSNSSIAAHEEAPTLPSEASQEHLSSLARIHCFLILNKMVPSISVEISMLFRLLTSYNSSNPTISCIFSEWNGPYFSCKVLASIHVLVKAMGSHLAKLLVQNHVLQAFEPALIDELLTLPTRVEEDEINLDNLPYRVPMTSRHHFKTQQEQLVYNNREKMLDAFFQLLREHDPRRTPMTDWGAFSEKVADFLTKLLPANIQWFAELFVSILLRDEDFVGEQLLEGFSLPQSDKLRKLSQRVAPSIGPSQLATFPHLQEFFLKFLLDANHYAFSTQLLAVSVDKLYSLMDMFKEKPKSISLSSYIRQTRILAKFCGLLVVWPYSTQPLTPTLLPSPSAAYSKPSQSGGSGIQLVKETKLASLPILDLVMLLCDDAKNGNLAQTLPWVVEFLTMLKYSAAVKETTYYQTAVQICKNIYKSISLPAGDKQTLLESELFLLVMLEEFFNIVNEDHNIITIKLGSIDVIASDDVILQEEFLRICFPFLHGICETLKSAQRKSRSTHQKKITPSQPATSILIQKSPSKPTPASPLKLKPKADPVQAALRQAFFACHPAIAIAREFLLQIVPQNCCTCILDFVAGMTNVHLDKLRPLEMVGNVVLDDFLPAIQAEVSKELQPVLRKYCVTKICASVSALVPDNTDPRVSGAAIGLISEVVIQRANELCFATVNIRVRNVCLDWIHTNISSRIHASPGKSTPGKSISKTIASSPQQTPPKHNGLVYTPPKSKSITSPKGDYMTSESISGLNVTQQACAILQSLIADTAQITFVSKKSTNTISPLDKLITPLKALGSSLANGDCSISHNVLLELTAGASRLLLYSHNVAISNVTTQSKPVWDELFSIWQAVGASRLAGKALCHHMFLPFGQSNLDWDGAFSDCFAHLLVRGIISQTVLESKWREIIEAVQLGEAGEWALGMGMCDFVTRLFSIHDQLSNDPTFHINYTFHSEPPPALPPTPASPATPAPRPSHNPTSPTSPYVPPSPFTPSTSVTPKRIQLLFTPTSPPVTPIPTQPPLTPTASLPLPPSTHAEQTDDSSVNFETKIRPQFYEFVVWLVARLRGPAKLLVEQRILEIFGINQV